MKVKFWLALVLALGIGVWMGTCAPAMAQTAINPTTVQFTASADHNTMLGDAPILTRYELRIFLSGATQPFTTQDLGKPVPDGSNTITVVNQSWFAVLAMNTTYTAKVAAIGPAGEGVSDASNPFGNAAAPRTPTALVVKR